MPDIQIREAGIEDLDLLMQWRMETLRNVFPPDLCEYPADLEEQNRDYYEKALPAGGHIACFALLDGETVGCGGLCLYREMPSPDNPTGECAYLMNIYTRAPFRGLGVGETVVRWLIARARELHIPKIYLETSYEGRRLYEKLGFQDLPDIMKLRDI